MASFLSTLKAIFEGVKILGALSDYYKKWKDNRADRRIDDHYEAKQSRRARLVAQMKHESNKEEPNDDILRDLHKRLRNLESDIL